MEIQKEYYELLLKRANLERRMGSKPRILPAKKNVKRRICYFIKYNEQNLINTKSIKNILSISPTLIMKELPNVDARIKEIEKRSELLGGEAKRIVASTRSIFEIDVSSIEQKQEGLRFSEAITSIEGAPVSEPAKNALKMWSEGTLSYVDAMNSVLKHYGFVKE